MREKQGEANKTDGGKGSARRVVGKSSMKRKKSLLNKQKNIGTERETKGKTDFQHTQRPSTGKQHFKYLHFTLMLPLEFLRGNPIVSDKAHCEPNPALQVT